MVTTHRVTNTANLPITYIQLEERCSQGGAQNLSHGCPSHHLRHPSSTLAPSTLHMSRRCVQPCLNQDVTKRRPRHAGMTERSRAGRLNQHILASVQTSDTEEARPRALPESLVWSCGGASRTAPHTTTSLAAHLPAWRQGACIGRQPLRACCLGLWTPATGAGMQGQLHFQQHCRGEALPAGLPECRAGGWAHWHAPMPLKAAH